MKVQADMNKYEKVMIAALRARELAEGIGLTPENEGRKITTVAVEDMEGDKVKYGENEIVIR